MTVSNVLLIDSAVRDYQTFVDSVNSNTFPLVYSSTTTRQNILDSLNFTTIDRIGIVNERMGTLDGRPFFSQENIQFFKAFIQTFSVKHIDFLACNTLNQYGWNRLYSTLQNETDVIIGASDNNTGNLKYGGDWIMETSSEDVELIYFTTNIQYYQYVLEGVNDYIMVIKTDGFLWGVGMNTSGQLGDGSNTDRTTFVKITTSRTPKFIAVGYTHTFVLMTDGSLWATGSNSSGQLGLGNTTNYNTFQLITSGISGRTIKYISCGAEYTIVVMTDGTLWGTGINNAGQLGLGNYTNQTTFQQITIPNGLLADTVRTWADYTAVIMTNGTLWSAGGNYDGQFGVGNTTIYNTLVQATGITQAKKLGVSASSTIVSLTDGTLYGAGLNSIIGMNVTSGSRTTFGPITTNISGKFASDITCGYQHTVVLMSDNTLWGTGLNNNGQTMDGTNGNTRYTFNQVTSNIGGKTPKFIAAGTGYTYVMMSDGTLWMAGIMNNNSQLFGGSTSILKQILTNVSVISGYSLILPITITTITQAANGLVTINGTDFSVPTVTMTGGYTSGTVTKVSSTQLTFTPSATIGSATFTVTDSGNSASLTVSFPSVTSITQAASGLVTINGTNFTTPTVTMTGGFTSGTVTRVSATQLTFTPSSFIGSATFTVTNSGSSVAFTASFPTITSVSQASNGLITLNGTNFISPTVSISGGYTSGTVTKVSSTQLTFTPNTFLGNNTITVTDSGSSVSYVVSFFTVTRMSQSSNGLITVTGNNFVNPSITISGGYTSGTVTKVSSSQLTFTPNSFIGNATFTVTDSGNTVFFVASFPTITSFTPSIGSKNTTVTIIGNNLGNVTSVMFGTVSAPSPISTASSVTVNVPYNIKSVNITLTDSNGSSVVSSSLFKYTTNSRLFTTSLIDQANNLLTQLSLTDGIADTGTINIGSELTTTNFLGSTYGTTMSSSDNSSSLATTAFVKAQGYSTISGGSLTGYAQMAATQTWSAIQTFSSGILSSTYNALTATSTVSVGSNLTTGTLNLATSTATLNLNAPFSPNYTSVPTSTQIGYNITLAPLNTSNFAFSGVYRVSRFVSLAPGTYIVSASAKNFINLDYFFMSFVVLKNTPAANADIDTIADTIGYESAMNATASATNVVLSNTVWSTACSLYIPVGYTTLGLITCPNKSGNPSSYIETSMSVTRIA